MKRSKKVLLVSLLLLSFAAYLSDAYRTQDIQGKQVSKVLGTEILGTEAQATLIPQKKLLAPQDEIMRHASVSVEASSSPSATLSAIPAPLAPLVISQATITRSSLSIQAGFGGGGGGVADVVDSFIASSSVSDDTEETIFPDFSILSPEISASSSACGD